jgi:hypothetical protein
MGARVWYEGYEAAISDRQRNIFSQRKVWHLVVGKSITTAASMGAIIPLSHNCRSD